MKGEEIAKGVVLSVASESSYEYGLSGPRFVVKRYADVNIGGNTIRMPVADKCYQDLEATLRDGKEIAVSLVRLG